MIALFYVGYVVGFVIYLPVNLWRFCVGFVRGKATK